LDFIPRLWATRQVGVLLEQIRLEGEKQALVDEVTQLGTTYGIVTPYTSYLITEPGYQGVTGQPLRPTATRREEGGRIGDRTIIGGMGGEGEAAPPAAAAPMAEEGLALMGDADELKKDSGEKAVVVAKAVGKMKGAEVARGQAGTVREVEGKTFRWKDGGWVDDAARGGTRVKIKPYSQAYMDLAAASKALARWLALGERVTLEYKGFIIELADDGAETLPPALQKVL
ncbi:MAG: hypothetical protein FJ098_11290, partial [Deltaproteobacteria bacterium]|nr:hypothetical protein [Deltaproteobacteria bacterium]